MEFTVEINFVYRLHATIFIFIARMVSQDNGKLNLRSTNYPNQTLQDNTNWKLQMMKEAQNVYLSFTKGLNHHQVTN